MALARVGGEESHRGFCTDRIGSDCAMGGIRHTRIGTPTGVFALWLAGVAGPVAGM